MQQEDWDALKAQMNMPFGSMKLQCDQFVLTLEQRVCSKSKSWRTCVFVNGLFKGEWTRIEADEPQHEEGLRFLRRVSKSLYSAKEVEALRKVVGKCEAEKYAAKKYVYLDPTWSSFNCLKKHLVVHNFSITRIH